MLNRLPPLNAVRAFAAAARHLSFTHAASELHVTHSAVSRQIKQLESHLGVALFERKTRQVLLTENGHRFHAQISVALEKISDATQLLIHAKPPRAVRINVRPTFAVRWLIPRLADFVEKHPSIEPQVITSTLLPVQATEDFDIAIRRSAAGWPAGMQVQAFLEDEVMLVGAPTLFAKNPVPDLPSLSSHSMLQAKSRIHDWERWKKHIDMPDLKLAGRLQFDHLHLVLQAAVDGLGVALAPTTLIKHDLAAGRLISPFPAHRMALNRYYLGLSANANSEVKTLVKWMQAQDLK
jgi:LysR family transcriptional regulator, glycine cleavage system transcriptional activator